MDKELIKIFNNIDLEMNSSLESNIWNSISKKEKKIAEIKAFSSVFVSLLSLVSFVPLFKILLNQFATSGFYEYLSVAFSDIRSVSFYWKELMYSLGESLPVLNIIFVFGIIFVFFVSVRYALKQIVRGQLSLSF